MKKLAVISLAFIMLILACGCGQDTGDNKNDTASSSSKTEGFISSPSDVPAFADTPFVTLNDNEPEFSEKEKTDSSFERYSPLDSLGRCGEAFACVGRDIMPTEDRGSIGQVKPSGWKTVKYDIVDGKYLYNRCHLIGYQLTGENANEENLITGTRYMNVDGMLPFENMVADYVKETGNHVLYRVTPVFTGNELVCRGVQMEAYSVEDEGDGISFNVFVYNNQPGIEIDYKTGDSREIGESVSSSQANGDVTVTFALNTNSKKYHLVNCKSVEDMNPNNKKIYTGPLSGLEGYSPCGNCKPLEALK